jgi:hypothetical protein
VNSSALIDVNNTPKDTVDARHYARGECADHLSMEFGTDMIAVAGASRYTNHTR